MDEKDLTWGLSGRGLPEGWPLENGEPEHAELLTVQQEGPFADMTANMLEAYGIPVYKNYQTDGTFARVLFGASAYGVGLLVPVSRLEEARDLLTSEPDEAETEDAPEDGTER